MSVSPNEYTESTPQKYGYYTIMSKCRYNQISNRLKDIIGDEEKWESSMSVIREIMKFDINNKASDPARTEKLREARQRKAQEMNTSIYEACNFREAQRKAYLKKKGLQSKSQHTKPSSGSSTNASDTQDTQV